MDSPTSIVIAIKKRRHQSADDDQGPVLTLRPVLSAVLPADVQHSLIPHYATNPYPSRLVYENLAEIFQVEIRRIKNWFNTRRSRDWKDGKICRKCRFFKSPIDQLEHDSSTDLKPCYAYWNDTGCPSAENSKEKAPPSPSVDAMEQPSAIKLDGFSPIESCWPNVGSVGEQQQSEEDNSVLTQDAAESQLSPLPQAPSAIPQQSPIAPLSDVENGWSYASGQYSLFHEWMNELSYNYQQPTPLIHFDQPGTSEINSLDRFWPIPPAHVHQSLASPPLSPIASDMEGYYDSVFNTSLH